MNSSTDRRLLGLQTLFRDIESGETPLDSLDTWGIWIGLFREAAGMVSKDRLVDFMGTALSRHMGCWCSFLNESKIYSVSGLDRHIEALIGWRNVRPGMLDALSDEAQSHACELDYSGFYHELDPHRSYAITFGKCVADALCAAASLRGNDEEGLTFFMESVAGTIEGCLELAEGRMVDEYRFQLSWINNEVDLS